MTLLTAYPTSPRLFFSNLRLAEHHLSMLGELETYHRVPGGLQTDRFAAPPPGVPRDRVWAKVALSGHERHERLGEGVEAARRADEARGVVGGALRTFSAIVVRTKRKRTKGSQCVWFDCVWFDCVWFECVWFDRACEMKSWFSAAFMSSPKCTERRLSLDWYAVYAPWPPGNDW